MSDMGGVVTAPPGSFCPFYHSPYMYEADRAARPCMYCMQSMKRQQIVLAVALAAWCVLAIALRHATLNSPALDAHAQSGVQSLELNAGPKKHGPAQLDALREALDRIEFTLMKEHGR